MKEFLSHAKYVIQQNKITSGAFVVFFLIVFIGIFGSMIAQYDPLATDTTRTFLPPCSEHWFGTDHVGRDIFSRILVATQLDLKIAVLAVTISIFFGTIVGCLAGYFGGWVDRIASRIVDTIMAFPLFVLAMGIVAALGNTVENIIYATAIINFPFYARVSRAEVNVRRNMEYIKAARISGNGEIRIIFAHILPNILPPMMVQVSLNLGWAILNAAGLSFIGLEFVLLRRNGASWLLKESPTLSLASGGFRSSPDWRLHSPCSPSIFLEMGYGIS